MNKDNTKIYNGGDITGVNFGLYQYDDINFDDTKSVILYHFKTNYMELIHNELFNIGLSLEQMKYFSPKYYNYQNDTIDFTIKVIDENKYLLAIRDNENELNELLKTNKSSDGYLALTVDNILDEITVIKNGYSPDIMIISYFVKKYVNFKGFDVGEYIQWDN